MLSKLPIADVSYLLVAVAIGHPLLARDTRFYGLLALWMMVEVGLDRLLETRWPPWLRGGAVALANAALGGVLGHLSGIDLGTTILVVAIPLAVYALLGPTREQAVGQAVALAVPLMVAVAGLVLVLDPVPVRALVRRLLAWSLLAWPFIALLSAPRRWWWVPLGGGPLLLPLFHDRLAQGGLSWLEVGRAGLGFWQHLDPAMAAVQVGLVLMCVFPLLLESSVRWRLVLGVSLVVFVGTVAILMGTGPWTGGWPWYGQLWLMLSSVGALAGVVGMLCSVQRPALLDLAAGRTMALGVEVSAVFLLMLELGGDALPGAVIAASMPVALAYCLVAISVVAKRVARRWSAPVLITERIESDERSVEEWFRRFLVGILHALHRIMGREAYAWLSPQGLVPLLVFAACWPALIILGTEQLVVWSVLPALAFSSLAAGHLGLWCFGHVTMICAVSWLVGVPPVLLPICGAASLLCAWPFVTWQRLDQIWAYPVSLLALAPIWTGIVDAEGLSLLMVVGLAILLVNALRRDRFRLVLFLMIDALGVIHLLTWMARYDRYAASYFLNDIDPGATGLQVLMRMPAIIVLLGLLWFVRHHGGELRRRWLWSLAFILVGGVIALHWVMGYRANSWQALAMWAALLGMAPLIFGGMQDVRFGEAAIPLQDACALVLVVLLNAAARAQGMWLGMVADAEDAGPLTLPGLGSLMREMSVDAGSIIAGLIGLLIGRILYPRLLAAADWTKQKWSLIVE